MASKKVADHTLYHLSPKGFWKKFRDAVVVNPEISSGLPLPSVNRMPPPGSRPEVYATPATRASDPAQNPYWKRDMRRLYPQLSVVTQDELATFLLQAPASDSSESSSSSLEQKEQKASTPARSAPTLGLAIATLHSAGKAYSESRPPPTPATPFKRWTPQFSPPAPHDPHAYFPMSLVK